MSNCASSSGYEGFQSGRGRCREPTLGWTKDNSLMAMLLSRHTKAAGGLCGDSAAQPSGGRS